MPRGIPLTKEERERVRRRIFGIASRLFLRQGFLETSMRQIAKAAGMGKATIYDYFPRKEEIPLYFMEKMMEVTHVAAAEISQRALPAPQKLRLIMKSLWGYLTENRRMALLVAKESSRLGEDGTRRLAARRRQYRAILERIIRQGIKEGTLRAVNPGLAASSLHSMMTVPFYDGLLRRSSRGHAAGPEDVAEIFLWGVAVK